jgi:DNA-binding GntR family transcriptional regulator
MIAIREPPIGEQRLRRVLAEQVKEWLLQRILEGRYAPDTRLVELQIARDLGTSQAPVREALRGLEALGVVEITPFRGARVRRPSSGEILEAYAVRSELESLGARLAVPRMTGADLDELGAHVEDMQRSARAGDPRSVAVADARFHGRIVQIAGNGTLERVWRALEPFSSTLITLIMPGADPQWTADLHEPILTALRGRDSALATAALRRHFVEAEGLATKLWADAEARSKDASPGPATGRPRESGPGAKADRVLHIGSVDVDGSALSTPSARAGSTSGGREAR